MSKQYLQEIMEAAQKELDDERRRAAIEEAKERLRRKRPWFHKLFPFKVNFTRR